MRAFQMMKIPILCYLTLIVISISGFTLEERLYGVENAYDSQILNNEWRSFQEKYARRYDNKYETMERFHIFASNLIKIVRHNRLYHMGQVGFEMEVNNFTDKRTEELQYLRGLVFSPQEGYMSSYIPTAFLNAPKSVDWREKGAVTGIKDQGQCGSCWAFSATGAIEGQNFRKNGVLVSISEQQLVDCSSKFGNEGCAGGLMNNAFKYVKENGGIDSEKAYPYVSGKDGRSHRCEYNPADKAAVVTGYMKIQSGNESMLLDAVATRGPVSVAINAGLDSFMSYKKGIYDDPKCKGGKSYLDHGVLVVGYGEERGIPYWIIKNSWGTSWGESGYIRIRRSAHNLCGVATEASIPLV